MTLTLPAGVQTYSLTVRLKKDNLPDDGETVTFRLAQLPAALQAGTQTASTLTIIENSEYITGTTTGAAGVRFYPNPAGRYLYVEGLPEGADLQLIDARGQIVESWQHHGSRPHALNRAKGLYFIRYMHESRFYTQKIFVE